jgi:hypothetical protein
LKQIQHGKHRLSIDAGNIFFGKACCASALVMQDAICQAEKMKTSLKYSRRSMLAKSATAHGNEDRCRTAVVFFIPVSAKQGTQEPLTERIYLRTTSHQ